MSTSPRLEMDPVSHSGARRYARIVSACFAAAPLLWLALVYGFVLHWRWHYGAWPHPADQRTNLMGPLAVHETIAGCGFFFLLLSLPVWLAFIIFLHCYIIRAPRFGLIYVPWLLAIALVLLDPGRWMMWFFGQ